MAIAEGNRYMGRISDSSERPRFSLFHRRQKTVELPDGQIIPIVDDINAFAAEIVVKEIEEERLKRVQGQQPSREPVAEQGPLVKVRAMLAGLAGGTVKS